MNYISLFIYFIFIVISVKAQDKSVVQDFYKDELYKYQIKLPLNYLNKKISNEQIIFREKKDIEQTVRVASNIIHFETLSSTGNENSFSEFVKSHSHKIYKQSNLEYTDSLIIKNYNEKTGIKGNEVYVKLTKIDQNGKKNNEEQVIKGPIYIFDISAKTGIPGTALELHQVTDDSKTTRAFRIMIDELKIGE